MHFLTTAALALLATSVKCSPFNTTKSKDSGLVLNDTAKTVSNHTKPLGAISAIDHFFSNRIHHEEVHHVGPIEDEDFDDHGAFHSFLRLLVPFGLINPNFTAYHSSHASISRRDIDATNPLILAMNATINALIFDNINNVTINNEGKFGKRGTPWETSPKAQVPPEKDQALEKRAQHSWEISGGTRGPPCPGWPIWQRFNATHETSWSFLKGKIYRKINPACPVANGHP